MEKATISRLKNNLSAYLRAVRAGQRVVIYDRNIPVAQLERIEMTDRGSDRLVSLCAQGIIKPPLRRLSAATLLKTLSNPLRRSGRLVDALLDDRLEDR